MNETPPQQDEQTRDGNGTGVATENLRSYERLRRSITDRKIAGVAGGLGRHLNIDPTVLRVLFVVLVFFGGAGLVLYAAAWLIVPEEGSDEGVVSTSPSTRNTLLIVAGVLAALLLVGDSWGGFGFPWPLAIVALVVFLVLVNRDTRRGQQPPPGAPMAPTGHQPGWAGTTEPPASSTAGGSTDTGSDTRTDTDTDTDTGTATWAGQQYAAPAGPPPPYTWQTTTPAPPPRPSRRDRGPILFGFTLAFVAIALGGLGLYEASGGTVVDAAYPALALTVVGAMLVVGAWFGRPGGLLLLGIIASIALALTSVVDGNWGDHRITAAPTSAAAVSDSYEVGAGRITLDLTDVTDLENLDGRTIRLDNQAGEVVVRVPDGLDVDVAADIRWGGEIDIDGQSSDGGNGVELNRHIDGGTDVPEINLDIDLLVGHVDVVQEEAA